MNKYNEVYFEKLSKYYQVCEDLKNFFIEKYFCSKKYKIEDVDMFWIADKVGTILAVNDCFFGMEDMVLALEENVSKKKLFAYYDQSIEEKPDSLKTLYSYIHNNKNGKN